MSNEQRHNSRFKTGKVCYLKLDNYYFPLIDISEGGFLAEIYEGMLKEGDVIDIEININDRHGSISFKTTTEILRTKNKYVAGKWDLIIDKLSDKVQRYFYNRYNKLVA